VGDLFEQVGQGVNGFNGPRSGLSIYREELVKKGYKVPTFEQMFEPNSELIPLYKGSFFSHFDPFYLGHGHEQHYGNLEAKKRAWAEQVEQFGVREKLYENENTRRFIESEKIAWRGISRSTDQRTLIPSLIPAGSFSDGNVSLGLFGSKVESTILLANLSCLVVDFFCRYSVTAKVTSGVVLALSVLEAPSKPLQLALKLVSDTNLVNDLSRRIQFDGEMILHFSQASTLLSPEDIISVFTTRFAALNRAQPDFFPELLQYLAAKWNQRRVA